MFFYFCSGTNFHKAFKRGDCSFNLVKRREEIKTRLKVIVGTMVTLLLISMAFYSIPIRAAGTIKIGVIGPMAWIQGQGMKEGAEIARDEINTGGGILGNTVEIVTADDLRGQPDPTPETGKAAAEELMAAGVDFVIGGFRTESLLAAREVFMDYKKILFIAGAATDELVDDGAKPNPYGGDVRENYARYKYTFRVTPINSTMLFKSIAAFLKYAMLTRLMPIYTKFASPLKIAVISEQLVWADVIHAYLSNTAFWNVVMGMGAYGGVQIVYTARISPVATDFSTELQGVKDSQARLLIHVISGPEGRAFITQWSDMGVKAVPLGIDVPGQEIPTHWDATGGKCQFEGFLATNGQRTPLNARIVAFYDKTVSTYGHAPIYTSYGVYDGIIALDEMIEAAGKWPMTSDEMVPLIEKTDRANAITGKFKYTGPNPGNKGDFTDYDPNTPGDQPYPYVAENPAMMGTLHDVFSNELGPEWKEGYMRALFTQWQAGRLEVVYPLYQEIRPSPYPPIPLPYTKIFMLPRLMYPYPSDIIQVPPYYGVIDIYDALTVRGAFGTRPGDPAWVYAADVVENKEIELFDALQVRADYAKHVALPLPYCSEGGRLS